MRSLLTVFCLLGAVKLGDSLKFTPNSLATKLKDLGVVDWDIPSLVCLAHNASNLDTSVTNHRSDLGYWYYGIFGIPHALFSHSPCSHLSKQLALDDDISDDVSCVVNMIRNGGYFKGNRTDSLLVFTPHDVDLGKCFDWWDSLPPFSASKSFNDSVKCPEVHHETTASPPKATFAPEIHTRPPQQPSAQQPTCPPITAASAAALTDFHCPSIGFMTNFLLFWLNLCLAVLCVIAYFVLKQLKVNSAIKRFDNSLL